MLSLFLLPLALLPLLANAQRGLGHGQKPLLPGPTKCIVHPGGDPMLDDAPAIIQAFEDCGVGGKVIFLNETYHVNSIMNTTGLRDCEVEIHGTLLWSTDIDYWLSHSMRMGYQNQSTAWFFGGRNLRVRGFGYGTLDGNGQVWYDRFGHISNLDRRPHQITIWETYDSVFEGLRFVQSQMWTMTLIQAKNVLLQDIFVRSVGRPGTSTMNTDGADTIYASNITFSRWHVTCGDDCISPKANSSDIFVYDTICEQGSGLAMGSIGQYPGVYEYIENFYARNVTFRNTRWAIYAKTWTGVQKNYPPNGGGGGLGYMKNITLTDAKMEDTEGAFHITQCISFSGATGDCDTSRFQISDLHWGDMTGTTRSDLVADLQCSGAAPCKGIEIANVNLRGSYADKPVERYRCSNVVDTIGFECNA